MVFKIMIKKYIFKLFLFILVLIVFGGHFKKTLAKVKPGSE